MSKKFFSEKLKQGQALFSLRIFLETTNVALLFVFDNYYSIMNESTIVFVCEKNHQLRPYLVLKFFWFCVL